MASALDEVSRRAHLLLRREGYQALGEWLLRPDEPKILLRVPSETVLPLWKASEHQFDDEIPTVFCADFYAISEQLLDLGYLDRQKGLSPRLWFRPEGVRLNTRERAQASDGFPCLSFLYGLPWLEETGEREPGTVYVLGMELGVNPWWRAESKAAARTLAGFPPRQLADEVRRGEFLAAGGGSSAAFWDIVGRERQMHVRELASADPWEERVAVRPVRMPELGAIPFYHRDQLPELHEAVVKGQVKLSLLGRLADSGFKVGRLARLRERFGYPRIETRGRPGRDPTLVERVRRLVEEDGLSKYAAAKQLHMKRPTVYGYLRPSGEARGRKGRD